MDQAGYPERVFYPGLQGNQIEGLTYPGLWDQEKESVESATNNPRPSIGPLPLGDIDDRIVTRLS